MFISVCASISVLATAGAASERKTSQPESVATHEWQPSQYDRALLDLKPDNAIRMLCGPLNRALETKDNERAALLMRMIALSFRLDENDDAAAQAASIAYELNPKDELCHFQLGEYFFRVGNWRDGEKIYTDLEKNSDPKISKRAEAFLAQQRGSVALTIDLLEPYVKKYPEDQRALLKLGNLYSIDEQFDKAAAIQRKLASLCHSDYMKEIFLGRASESEKKITEAESHYKTAGKINENDPLWHFQLGIMYMKKQRIKEADKEFRQCFACKRMIGLAYTNWAVMESFFGSNQNAEKSLDCALRLRPHSSELCFARGIVEEKQGKLEKARAQFENAIAFNPHNSSPYLHLLQISDANKEPLEKRIELCRNWSMNCTHSAAARIELGKALLKAGREDEALKSLLDAEALTNNRVYSDKNMSLLTCTMHAYISAIYYSRKDTEKALKEALLFNKLKPVDPPTAGLSLRLPKIDLEKLNPKAKEAAEHALLADILYECHHLDDAQHEYEQAEKADSTNISYHSCLLKVLLDKKDYSAAMKEDAAVSNHIITHIPDLFK